ncbi:TIGR03435 family protein [Granulicella sp. S156]|jgi:uncharacterized protein (TIGR03435 family)|uniref:TIGR03435 family protein n=1 Tax=Granulicella sp. S156 TaxID=1747224 RepID=UPI00131CBA91|nr:TIGR03435 family protein [Granulicella sp. S156]
MRYIAPEIFKRIEPVAGRSFRRKKSWARLVVALLVFANLLSSVAAQSLDGPSGKSQETFEVASIRSDKSPGRPVSDFPIGPGRSYVPRRGNFRATHLGLLQYVGFAYDLTDNQMDYLADNVPEWVRTESFDISAVVEGKPGKDQLRDMMRSLLESRFSLVIDKQDREVGVLALVLAKPRVTGPNLLPHSSTQPCPQTAPTAESNETVSGGFPAACHGVVVLPASSPGRLRLGARDATLSFIADALSALAIASLGHPLVDRTGLPGTFDFTLEYSPELNGPLPPDETFHPDPSGPTFREALQEQLGLKLEAQKATVKVFVINHVEHPTEN